MTQLLPNLILRKNVPIFKYVTYWSVGREAAQGKNRNVILNSNIGLVQTYATISSLWQN